MGYYILIGAIALVSWLVSSRLKSKFKHYSKVHLQNGMSGAEIAEKMLSDHGIRDVKVISTPGMLTDHYNPKNKSVTSGMSTWVVFGGLILGAAAGVGFGYWVAVAGLVMMGLATLFSFITLPVEYDASNRALAWLKSKNVVTQSEYKGSEDALKWATRTYLVAAIGSLATLVYWGLQVFGGRD